MDREAITTANQLKSPLIRLPGEIRNRVYKLAFCGENTTRNALLKTCKQIEHEAKPIYYSNLTLSFGKPWNLRRLINGVELEMCAKITSVRAHVQEASYTLGNVRYTSFLPGLEYWHIYPEITSYYHRKGIVDGIRKVMGRDVEVTFGPDD
ncbi:unnamed protein product [Alternaria alternata]